MALALAGVLATGCGSERQDEDEPDGEFTLDINGVPVRGR